jgi:hypothetical protein
VRIVLAAVAAVAIVAAIYFATASGSTPACPAIDRGVLPEWARTGFSEPEPKAPHLIGDDGRIAAILFGDPLSSPPDRERANKILWVAREPVTGAADLQIRAQDGDTVVERKVAGGPGPSIIDLPHAGCWQLTLAWAGQKDRLRLAYETPDRRESGK